MGPPDDPSLLTALEARTEIEAGNLSAVELTKAVIARAQRLNQSVNAYLELDAEGALEQAQAADRRPDRPPLLGIPVAVKAVIDVAGLATTAGAARWRRFPKEDAAVVKLLRSAGAVILGAAHTNEFAYGIDGRNPHWGDCRNPRDPSRLSGGSSSGPAAATAAGMALAGLGTDTSGSIRVPASFCGLVGLRPTPGALPLEGIVPLAPSYDVPGVMARNVADVEAVFDALARARQARTGRSRAGDDLVSSGSDLPLANLRVGVVEELMELVEPYVASGIGEAMRRLESAGASVETVHLPVLGESAEVHRVIQQSEAAHVHEPWFESQRTHYSEPVRARLEAGRSLLATAYLAAVEARRRIAAEAADKVRGLHVLVAPTAALAAPTNGEADVMIRGIRSPLRSGLLGCVVPTTQLGGPIISVPVGTHGGLPYGMQIVGRPDDEALVFRVARECEIPLPPVEA